MRSVSTAYVAPSSPLRTVLPPTPDNTRDETRPLFQVLGRRDREVFGRVVEVWGETVGSGTDREVWSEIRRYVERKIERDRQKETERERECVCV